METIKLTAHVGDDGTIAIEVPKQLRNQDVEIVMVLHPITQPEVDALGWPIGYFEQTYGSLAHDPIERGDQGEYEVRDEIL